MVTSDFNLISGFSHLKSLAQELLRGLDSILVKLQHLRVLLFIDIQMNLVHYLPNAEKLKIIAKNPI